MQLAERASVEHGAFLEVARLQLLSIGQRPRRRRRII